MSTFKLLQTNDLFLSPNVNFDLPLPKEFYPSIVIVSRLRLIKAKVLTYVVSKRKLADLASKRKDQFS